jgi:hypothetical protein
MHMHFRSDLLVTYMMRSAPIGRLLLDPRQLHTQGIRPYLQRRCEYRNVKSQVPR